jgi:nucleoid DNA-binding protein
MLSKSQLVEKMAAEHGGLSKKDVKGVLEALVTVGHKELKKTGSFLVPGFAKLVVIKKPATKGTGRDQSVHQTTNDFQSQAGSQDRACSTG